MFSSFKERAGPYVYASSSARIRIDNNAQQLLHCSLIFATAIGRAWRSDGARTYAHKRVFVFGLVRRAVETTINFYVGTSTHDYTSVSRSRARNVVIGVLQSACVRFGQSKRIVFFSGRTIFFSLFFFLFFFPNFPPSRLAFGIHRGRLSRQRRWLFDNRHRARGDVYRKGGCHGYRECAKGVGKKRGKKKGNCQSHAAGSMRAYAHTHLGIHTQRDKHTRTHTPPNTHIYTHTPSDTHTHARARTYSHTRAARVHTRTHIHTRAHTHAHAHTPHRLETTIPQGTKNCLCTPPLVLCSNVAPRATRILTLKRRTRRAKVARLVRRVAANARTHGISACQYTR